MVVAVMALGLGRRVFRLALILHPVPPLSTVRSHNAQCILDTPCHTSNPACGLDRIKPCLLLRAYASGRGLDLNAGEYSYLLAHHVWGDRDAPVADQVGAAFAQAKLHRAAIGIAQRAGVIAEQPGIAGAAGYPDVLLDGLLRRHWPLPFDAFPTAE
jgi:hypothetical protein